MLIDALDFVFVVTFVLHCSYMHITGGSARHV